jgi:putative transposase
MDETMPRPPRIQFEDAFYHVYSRGNRREPLFLDDQDYFQFERFLVEAVERLAVVVFAWCLMPNHLHLLLQTPNANVAEFMRVLLARYAKYFNWRHGLSGHVFERRYNAIVCDKDAYFLELIRYIHLNPYRVKGLPLANPGAWKWSSHRYYAGLKPPSALKKGLSDGLLRFGGEPAKARERYAAFLADGLKNGNWEDFFRPKSELYLGSDSFVEAIKKRIQQPVRLEARDLRRVSDLKELAEVVRKVFGVNEEVLRTRAQTGQLCQIRDVFIFAAVRRYRFQGAAVARFLGWARSSVSTVLGRFDQDLGRSRLLQQLMHSLQA